MRKSTNEIYAGLGFLAFGIAFGVQYDGLEGVSRVFPEALISFILAGGIYFVLKGLWIRRRENLEAVAAKTTPAEQAEPSEHIVWSRVGIIITMALIYLFLLEYIGFFVSTFGFLVTAYLILGDREHGSSLLVRSLLFAVPFTAAVWLLFVKLLNVPTPAGLLF